MRRDYGEFCGVTRMYCPECLEPVTLPVTWDPHFHGYFTINRSPDELQGWFSQHVAMSPHEHESDELTELCAWIDAD